jgi:hypothetical protein
VTGGRTLRTNGNVFSKGPINLGTAPTATLDASDNAVSAMSCVPDPLISANAPYWKTAFKDCAVDASKPWWGDGTTPSSYNQSRLGEINWASQKWLTSPTPTCTNNILTFSPGYYTRSTVLEDRGSCAAVAYWFRPGVYLLDFAGKGGNATDTTWDIPVGIPVVAGPPQGLWQTNGDVPPTPAPGATVPVACQSGAGVEGGAQFVLSADSRINVPSGASFEVCAANDSLAQRVALYGATAGTLPTGPQTFTLHPRWVTQAGKNKGNPSWSWSGSPLPPNGATGAPLSSSDPITSPIDGASATVSLDASQNGKTSTTLTLCDFDWPPASTSCPPLSGDANSQIQIPPGYTITKAMVRVAFTSPNVPLAVEVSNGNGASNMCALTFSNGDPPKECPALEVPTTVGGNKDYSGLLKATIAATNGTSSSQTVSVDGLEIDITYAPLRAQSATNSLVTLGATSKAAVWGTVYAPDGYLSANFGGLQNSVFDWGVIVGRLDVAALPDPDPNGRFRLGGGSGRTVVLSTTVSGQRARARVRIVDSANAVPHGYWAVVKEWSTAKP